MASILVIDDCVDTTTYLKDYFSAIGFTVTTANDGRAGLDAIENADYDIVILDFMLPKIDGLNLCRRIRSKKTYVPILMLSGRSDVADRVACLEAGADDYLTKPFYCQELWARVKALLRLVEALKVPINDPFDKVVQIGPLVLDLEKQGVIRNGRMTRLTKREMAVLSFMARNSGKVVTRAELLKKVWGYNNDCYIHAVDTLINRLRGKIEDNPAKPSVLLTIWGAGYTLNAGEPDESFPGPCIDS